MIYNEFQGKKLSALGMGCMRFPTINGEDANIDEARVSKMFARAMDNGINYYDTAWGYHAGQSEIVTGKMLKKYPRDSFYLASKFPGYDNSNMPKVKEIFEKQLEKCQVEYFDFYLFHNVCESNIDDYLNPAFGIYDYLMEQKKNGRIKHLGFSAHGDYSTMKRFLDAYGKDMEFGQIQLNWLDWKFQSAKEKVKLLEEYNIPVWVMEPVRGGSLASLKEEEEKQLKNLRPEESIAAWSFRFLQSIPQVVVTLSGMSNDEQVTDNLKTYEESKPLNEEEMALLMKFADEKIAANALPCTSCRYCTAKCPKELDIPTLIGLYNEHYLTGGGFIAPMALSAMPAEKLPSACIGCRSCEAVCPQQIKISEAMTDFNAKLG
ncbi:MAG: aldo/keto reductase [Lachnospiraceae bacterium]|nr:aldo/keto reductase [Lachnospiraceae bacterium]